MASWNSYLESNRDRLVEDYLDYLRIPSVSAQSEHAPDVRRAGEWVAARLSAMGIEHVRVLETGGHPVVYGDWLHAEGKPTVLVYGHFDVQPVDPLPLWTNPPFEPTLRDGRVYARGASDNKGNQWAALCALEAHLHGPADGRNGAGRLPLNVKLFLEGQEEIGSPQLPDFVKGHRDLLACDLAISTDGGQGGAEPPLLVTGCRGITALEIDVRGARRDLHSGTFGGAVQNALHALVRLLDSMRAPDGRITVEGFHDDVVLTDEERAGFARVPFDEAAYKRELGVDELFGEPGYTVYERLWGRPTLEVNGMWGGYTGEGGKTVLPNEAHAKITCRLVPNQDPARVQEAIVRHVERHRPPGVTIEVHRREGAGSRAYVMRADHPANRAALAVLGEATGKQVAVGRIGGTVPVYELLVGELGVECLSFGFSHGDEPIHAPDEFFRLESLALGQRAHAMLLERLADEDPASLRQH